MKRTKLSLPNLLLLVVFALPAMSDVQAKRFEAADSKGISALRDSTTLSLQVDANVKGPIKIPRLAAPLRAMMWQGSITEDGISLKPESDHWVISWTNRPAQGAMLTLQFDDVPLLMEEVKPIKKSTDGSFLLPGYLATTAGEKIRYEPQPYKNTLGFWTGKHDNARWTIQLDKPGRFNVAVLQGCGKDQGGSTAAMTFHRQDQDKPDATLDFEVMETGHFQNFQWVNLGEVELANEGPLEVVVKPSKIKKAALMDIRAIHLIRLPDKKK